MTDPSSFYKSGFDADPGFTGIQLGPVKKEHQVFGAPERGDTYYLRQIRIKKRIYAPLELLVEPRARFQGCPRPTHAIMF